jgi:biopolymer transport protein ExbD
MAFSKTKWRLGLLALVAVVALLPSLFLVITTISKPRVIQLSLSAPAANEPVGSPADALTILLGNGNQLYYYFGEAIPTAADSLHATTPVQPIEQTIKAWQQHRKATIFIKPVAESNYKALANILDEMNIVGQRAYKIVTPTDADRQLLLANGRQ